MARPSAGSAASSWGYAGVFSSSAKRALRRRSKFKAVNTSARTFTQAKMERRLAQIDESLPGISGSRQRRSPEERYRSQDLKRVTVDTTVRRRLNPKASNTQLFRPMRSDIADRSDAAQGAQAAEAREGRTSGCGNPILAQGPSWRPGQLSDDGGPATSHANSSSGGISGSCASCASRLRIIRISVCERAIERYAAMALMKRSPKMTAN